MNYNDHDSDQSISPDWRRLENIISGQVSPQPDEALDKQILAAAHREIKAPQKRPSYQLTWWRRLYLPLYVAAGFTFTVFAFKSILQAPSYQMEQVEETSQATSIQFSQEPTVEQQTLSQSSRIKRVLPQMQVVPDVPDATIKESPVTELVQQENADIVSDIDVQQIYTGTQLSKAVYPEKEAWARRIIGFMRNGENETARLELIRFKKAYPDYPIEEQIKVLSN